MDAEISSRFEALESRVKHQEDIHPDISLTAPGFIHGVISGLPIIIVSVALAALTTFVIIKYSRTA